jgi:hypothetical protein
MRRALIFSLLVTAVPLTALAQEGLDKGTKPEKDKAGAKDPGKATQEVQTNQPQEPRFKIRRGFFAEADLGMYLTFFGRNTNDTTLPSRFSSNLEPHLGVNIGYDVAHTDSFNLAVALRFAMGLNGGLGRVSSTEYQTATDPGANKAGQPDPSTKPADYSVSEVGLMVAASILTTDRFAITIRGDGGLGILDPDPTKAASTLDTMPQNLPDAGKVAFVPVFGVGAGVEYYTLLNDFTIGALIRFQGVLAPGTLIPAMSITFPIKYTF